MSEQIVIQKNGKLGLFSFELDNFTMINCEEEDIVNYLVEAYKIYIRQRVSDITSSLKEGGKPYYQFTTSFDECLKIIKDNHGKDEVKRILGFQSHKIVP